MQTLSSLQKFERSYINSSEGRQICTLQACIPQSTLTESCYETMIYQAQGILNSDTATFHLKSLPNPSYFALQNCHK